MRIITIGPITIITVMTNTILMHNNKTRNICESKVSECGEYSDRLGEAAKEDGEEDRHTDTIMMFFSAPGFEA